MCMCMYIYIYNYTSPYINITIYFLHHNSNPCIIFDPLRQSSTISLTSAVLGASLRGACGASGSSTISGGTGVVGARGGAWVRGRLGKRRRNEEK